MSMQPLDLAGQRFGKWIAISRVVRNKHPFWICRCDCGNELQVRLELLRNGNSQSCGCAKRRMPPNGNKYHGRYGTPENRVWSSMIRRCTMPSQNNYERYGGRGITVCERWLNSFEAFLTDMGPRPSKQHTLDRHPNNDGNYEPNNCRWATRQEQANNTRTNRFIEYGGKRQTVTEWAREIGIKPGTLHRRIHVLGMGLNRALTATDFRSSAS